VSREIPFGDLMVRLRGGDNDAAAEVFQRFAHRLILLARTRLDSRTRQKIDAEDVVQSAFRSFFARHARGQFDLADWNGLGTMLVIITLRKCGRKTRFYRRACRDLNREVPVPHTEDGWEGEWEALTREPAPSEAVLLTETFERLVAGLDPMDQQVLVVSLQGCTAEEISAQLGMNQRRVYRVLQRVHKRLERMRDEDNEPV
jgi:RNA polymerase sigma-70 factor (ECF subfamily)